jgi:hypothetical protein
VANGERRRLETTGTNDSGRCDVYECVIHWRMPLMRRIATFRLDEDLLSGLKAVQDRDGIPPSEQARRAIRAWLEAKGVVKAERKRAATRRRS